MTPNGCYNRPPFKRDYVAFDGYTDASRTQAQTIRITNVMSPDCQYTLTTTDPRCAGCIHESKA